MSPMELTPLTLEYVLEQAQPDLVLLTTATEDIGLGRASDMDIWPVSAGRVGGHH